MQKLLIDTVCVRLRNSSHRSGFELTDSPLVHHFVRNDEGCIANLGKSLHIIKRSLDVQELS